MKGNQQAPANPSAATPLPDTNPFEVFEASPPASEIPAEMQPSPSSSEPPTEIPAYNPIRGSFLTTGSLAKTHHPLGLGSELQGGLARQVCVADASPTSSLGAVCEASQPGEAPSTAQEAGLRHRSASKQGGKPASSEPTNPKKPSNQPSKTATKEASSQATRQPGNQATKQPSNQATKQATKQASKEQGTSNQALAPGDDDSFQGHVRGGVCVDTGTKACAQRKNGQRKSDGEAVFACCGVQSLP